MNHVSVEERTLRRALQLVGGTVPQLARALVVPAEVLERWLAGEEAPPAWVFLRAVDVILNETTPPESDPGDPPAPRDAAGPEDASCTWY